MSVREKNALLDISLFIKICLKLGVIDLNKV